ncbi:MAG: hypothetical protein CMB64_01260 [Euryarchaeota archaeon]|nr:hypothetical protein [Euryarchaeota archaeon]|tara:strand:- start:275 stop:1219 length:945 start_codon:yes stop_codon:yes gene_type:complete
MAKLKQITLDIVIPLYNDEEVIKILCETIFSELNGVFKSFRLILIDDGSKDKSYQKAMEMRKLFSGIEIIRLAGNFGQHRAILAGIRASDADIVAVMDSDLQDRPEDIPIMVEKMLEEDKPMAIARRSRRVDSWWKKTTSKAFGLISNMLVPFKVDPSLGAFRVLEKNVVKQVCEVKENTGTPFSMLYSLGIPYSIVDLERNARIAGSSGYTLRKSVKLASDRILTYSIQPIRLAIFLGMLFGLFSIGIAGYSIVNYGLQDRVYPGWTSIVFVTSFFGGLNLLFLGIIGEYIGRIYIESRGVPNYMIQDSTIDD